MKYYGNYPHFTAPDKGSYKALGIHSVWTCGIVPKNILVSSIISIGRKVCAIIISQAL